MDRKVLIVGLDGATWDILNPMMEGGHMPFLKSEIESGRSGVLRSTEPPITPAAWTSFQTGLSPEAHGVLGFRRFFVEDGRLQVSMLAKSSARHIWDILSENGRRVCLLNLPLTYPPFKINGILVSGFPVPSSGCEFTYPPEFKEEIFRLFPDFMVMQSGVGAKQVGMEIDEVAARWTKTMSQKTGLALHLLGKMDWDVFMVHLHETDMLQHYLWHCLDRSHPCHRGGDFKKVAGFYSALDGEISELAREGRKKGFSVIFLSDHGFQGCRYNLKMNNWLFRRGYLVLRRDLKRLFFSGIKRLSDFTVLHKLKLAMIRRESVENLTNEFLNSVINYEKSAVFAETNGTGIAYLHFFRANEGLKKRILDELGLLSAPGGGGIVISVEKSEHLADTYKLMLADGIVATGTVPDNKPIFQVPPPFSKMHVGVHHKDGIIIADETLKNCNLPDDICEVPKLIMQLQGIPFSPSIMNKSGSGISGQDSAEIEAQLKTLGYL